jgi:hypothetical protein
MTSEYVSYQPPTNVGMTMVEGPWFFDQFGGGWRFRTQERDGQPGTLATWKYTFSVRPAWLRLVGHPVGTWLLGREIRRRIAAFARACGREDVLRAVRAG